MPKDRSDDINVTPQVLNRWERLGNVMALACVDFAKGGYVAEIGEEEFHIIDGRPVITISLKFPKNGKITIQMTLSDGEWSLKGTSLN